MRRIPREQPAWCVRRRLVAWVSCVLVLVVVVIVVVVVAVPVDAEVARNV